jgi:predicted ATPase with chaperone activity
MWCIFRAHGCPCGYFTDPNRECRCAPTQIQRYIAKISGPLLDRIDVHVEVPRALRLGGARHRKAARTIADLSAVAADQAIDTPLKTEHVAEAIQYRTLDRDLWA